MQARRSLCGPGKSIMTTRDTAMIDDGDEKVSGSYLHCDALLSYMSLLFMVLGQDPNPRVWHVQKSSSSPIGKDWIFSETTKEDRCTKRERGDDLGISMFSIVNFYSSTATDTFALVADLLMK